MSLYKAIDPLHPIKTYWGFCLSPTQHNRVDVTHFCENALCWASDLERKIRCPHTHTTLLSTLSLPQPPSLSLSHVTLPLYLSEAETRWSAADGSPESREAAAAWRRWRGERRRAARREPGTGYAAMAARRGEAEFTDARGPPSGVAERRMSRASTAATEATGRRRCRRSS